MKKYNCKNLITVYHEGTKSTYVKLEMDVLELTTTILFVPRVVLSLCRITCHCG